jgi:beta-lactamase class A
MIKHIHKHKIAALLCAVLLIGCRPFADGETYIAGSSDTIDTTGTTVLETDEAAEAMAQTEMTQTSETTALTLQTADITTENPAETRQAEIEALLTDLQNRFALGGLTNKSGEGAVGFLDLSTGYAYNGDDNMMPAASIIKTFIMEYAYLQVAEGAVSLDTVMDGYTLEENIEDMITVSDNEATDRIIQYFGRQNIDDYLQEHYSKTRLHCTLANTGYYDYDRTSEYNDVCIADMIAVLKKFYDNRESYPYDEMIAVMTRQTRLSKIPKYIRDMEGVTVANKTGSFYSEYGYTDCDMAIVFTPGGDFIFAVLSTSLTKEEDDEFVESVAQAARDIAGIYVGE